MLFYMISALKAYTIAGFALVGLAIIGLCVVLPIVLYKYNRRTDVVEPNTKNNEMYDALVEKQNKNLNAVYKILANKGFNVTKKYDFTFFYRKSGGYGLLTPTVLFIDRSQNKMAIAYLLKNKLKISFVNYSKLFDYDIKRFTRSSGITTRMAIVLKFKNAEVPNYNIALCSAYKDNIAKGLDNMDERTYSLDTYDYDGIQADVSKVFDAIISINKDEGRI